MNGLWTTVTAPYRLAINGFKSFPVGCLPLIFIPGFLFLMAGLVQARPWQTARWQRASGEITFFGGVGPSSSKAGDQYTVVVEYRYVAGGVTHTGNTFNLAQTGTVNVFDFRELTRKYTVGKTVTIYYDSDDLNKSVLELNYGPASALMWVRGTLCTLGVAVVTLTWRRLRLGESNE